MQLAFTAIPCSMVINTRKLWGVTKKVQLITMRTLITMTFQMVLISWVYIWPQNRPKRSLSNLSWNFWVFPVTSSGRNGKQKGGECFCFGNFLALFVLPSFLCAHSPGVGDTIGIGPESRFQSVWNRYRNRILHIPGYRYQYRNQISGLETCFGIDAY